MALGSTGQRADVALSGGGNHQIETLLAQETGRLLHLSDGLHRMAGGLHGAGHRAGRFPVNDEDMKRGLRTPGHPRLFQDGGGNPYHDEVLVVESEEDPLNPPELGRRPRKPTNIPLLVLKWLAIILVPVAFVCKYWVFSRPRSSSDLAACRSNLKNVATALEMYSTDNAGQYPEKLESLLPGKYLNALPTCPAAGRMTFTDYQGIRSPDNFSLSCVGENHSRQYHKSAPNYPRYNGSVGLLEP